MKVLFLEWESYGGIFVKKEMERRGWEIVSYNLYEKEQDTRYSEELAVGITKAAIDANVDFIFSLNYFPVAAIAGNALNIKYVSWTYDSPSIQLYSKTIGFPTNIAFIFDYSEFMNLKRKGVNTVFYLPLATDCEYFDSIFVSEYAKEKYSADISLVGSMYTEKKNQLIRHFAGVEDYYKGYLDALVASQKGVYGVEVLTQAIHADVISGIQKVCPIYEKEDGIEDIEWVISKYFLSREVTAKERLDAVETISSFCKFNLFTNKGHVKIGRANILGNVDYYKEMPIVFKTAKINLNITLKSITSGIPLRAFDIMGCGGFLLTNYQRDFEDLFIEGEDYVAFYDINDMVDKVKYYLCHEEERLKIATSGYEKVKKYHTYKQRIEEIDVFINRVD